MTRPYDAYYASYMSPGAVPAPVPVLERSRPTVSTHPPRDTARGKRYREKTKRGLLPYLGPMPKKTARLLNEENLNEAATFRCMCGRNCMLSLSFNCVKETRERYLHLGGEHEMLQWLAGIVPVDKDEHQYSLPSLNHVLVCQATFLNVLGLSATKLKRARELASNGTPFVAQTSERPDPKRTSALAFLETFHEDECAKTTSGSHLPDDFEFQDVYNLYCQKEVDVHQRAGPEYFAALRKAKFPHLHPCDSLQFGRCKLCIRLLASLRKAKSSGGSPQELEKVMMEEKAHRALREDQKVATKTLDMRAHDHPDRLAMIYVDQTPVPAYPRDPRNPGGGLHRLRLLCGGTLSRATDTGAVFLSLHDDKGPNLVQTEIYVQLREILTSTTRCALARTLHVQCDLATGENHNRIMVGALGIYVHWGWVVTAAAGSQLEYHNYSLIDSTVHRPLKGALKHAHLHTPRDFVAAAQKAFKKEVASLSHAEPATPSGSTPAQRKAISVVWLANQMDWKSFLDQYVNKFVNITESRVCEVFRGNVFDTAAYT